MRHALTAALLATSMFSLPTAAHAQAMTAEEAAQLRAELAALKAKVQTLETRLDAATVPPAPAPVPVTTPAPPSVTAKPVTEISWKGAPEIKTADGWSFKPRGRIQLDVAGIDAPAGATGIRGGTATEFRRVYLGVDGKIPGGFSYRVEADIANSEVELTDIYMTYGTGPLSVTAGQIKPFWSLDDVTSDLFTSFTERAAFTQAFGSLIEPADIIPTHIGHLHHHLTHRAWLHAFQRIDEVVAGDRQAVEHFGRDAAR